MRFTWVNSAVTPNLASVSTASFARDLVAYTDSTEFDKTTYTVIFFSILEYQANSFSDAIARGELLAPAKTVAEMQTIIMSNQINAALCGFFMIVAIVMIIASIGIIRRALQSPVPTVNEAPVVLSDVPMTAETVKGV